MAHHTSSHHHIIIETLRRAGVTFDSHEPAYLYYYGVFSSTTARVYTSSDRYLTCALGPGMACVWPVGIICILPLFTLI